MWYVFLLSKWPAGDTSLYYLKLPEKCKKWYIFGNAFIDLDSIIFLSVCMSVPLSRFDTGQFHQRFHRSLSRCYWGLKMIEKRHSCFMKTKWHQISNIYHPIEYINLVWRYLYRCAYNNIPVYYILMLQLSIIWSPFSKYLIYLISTFYPFYLGVKLFPRVHDNLSLVMSLLT